MKIHQVLPDERQRDKIHEIIASCISNKVSVRLNKLFRKAQKYAGDPSVNARVIRHALIQEIGFFVYRRGPRPLHVENLHG